MTTNVAPLPLIVKPVTVTKRALFGKAKGGDLLISNFKITHKLGEGGFGSVNQAILKGTTQIVAIKKIRKSGIPHDRQHVIINEINNHSMIGDHPNIVPLINILWTVQTIYLILPVCSGGSLYEQWRPRGENGPTIKFTERATARYILSIASALEFVHSKSIVHRDVKLENCLIDQNDTVKLADFGCSVHSGNIRNTLVVGTVGYHSPEMVRGQGHGKEVDVWSLGVMLYEMIIGTSPFEDDRIDKMEAKIEKVKYRIPKDLNRAPTAIIKAMLKKKPEDRLKLCNLIKRKWIVDNTR